jgi:putative spermidine/putrescine transport system permease protein
MSRERSPRRGRIALRLYVGLAFAFLIAPLLVVFPISLSSSEYLQFPPPGLSLRWYQQYFGSPAWIDATVRSVVIGTAVSVLALALGAPLAYAVVRGRSPLLRIAERAVLAPIVVPSIVISVSIYGVFASLRLVGTWYAVALAHTLLALPFVVVVVAAGLRAVDPALERAAQGLGASRLGAVWHATLPQIRPSLITAALFAFVISFDELVIALFLTGAQATLPKRMFENITFAIDPTIAAVSVVKIMVVLAALLLSGVVVRRIAPAAPA